MDKILIIDDDQQLGLSFAKILFQEGYAAEKAKGNLVTVPAQGNWHFDLEIGALAADEAQAVEAQIEGILAGEKEPEGEE